MNDCVGGWPGTVVTAESRRYRDFEERLRDCSSLAVNVAYGVLRNRADAEDVAQDAFAKAFRRFGDLRDRERFRSWLTRMTWRLAIDRWRADRRRAVREQATLAEIPSTTHEDSAVERERSRHIWSAIDQLPEKLRAVGDRRSRHARSRRVARHPGRHREIPFVFGSKNSCGAASMACHRFTLAIRAHAHGAPLVADAAAHLAVCSACRSVFEREERLMAMIGGALDDVRSITPSPDFAARVHARVDEAPRWTMPAWRPAGAVAAIALTLAAAMVARRSHRAAAPAFVAIAEPAPLLTARSIVAMTTLPPSTSRRLRVPPPPVAAPPNEPRTFDVLVSDQERRAIGRLFASLRAGRPETVSMLLKLQDDTVVAPIAIPPVVVER